MKLRIYLHHGRWTWMFPARHTGAITQRDIFKVSRWCFHRNRREGR